VAQLWAGRYLLSLKSVIQWECLITNRPVNGVFKCREKKSRTSLTILSDAVLKKGLFNKVGTARFSRINFSSRLIGWSMFLWAIRGVNLLANLIR